LTLTRNPFASVAVTRNQVNVANAVDAGDGALANAIISLTSADAARGAFDQLSGEVHASTASILLDESRYMRGAVLGRLRGASYAGTNTQMASLAAGSPSVAYQEEELDPALAYRDPKSPMLPVKAPVLKAPARDPDYAFWAQGFGAWGRFNGDGNAAPATRTLAGFISGFDARVAPNTRLGFAAGYTGSRRNIGGRGTAAVHTAALAAT